MISKQIRFRVGKGDRTFFRTDLWAGEATLATSYLDLFNCASNQSAKIIDYIERIDDCIIWGPIFRRNEREESRFRSMTGVINIVFIRRDGKDKRVWMASTNGHVFSCFPIPVHDWRCPGTTCSRQLTVEDQNSA